MNINSVKFRIYIFIIISNLIAFLIGMFGSAVEKYIRFWYLPKPYYQVLFLIALAVSAILIFTLISKKFTRPFYNLLKAVKEIDPNNPQKQDLAGQYQNKGNELYELAKAVTVLNDAIVKKQEENTLIVSNINYFSNVISTADDLNSLINKLINIVVEKMGYTYAWFGVLDDANKDVSITNVYNNDFTYPKNLILKYDGSKYSENPTSRAINSKSYVFINDVYADENIPLYKERLLKFGFLSVGIFPLTIHGNVFGVLGLYSDKKFAFDEIKAESIFILTKFASYFISYLRNFKRSLLLSEMAESVLFSIANRDEKYGKNLSTFYGKGSLDDLENALQADFVEFIVYDNAKNLIVESIFSKGWDYNIGISSIAPSPTRFVVERIKTYMLNVYDYQTDEFATSIFKDMGVRDIMLYSFKGAEDRSYLAVTGVIKRRKTFIDEDLKFFSDTINLFTEYLEMTVLFNKLSLTLELLENRENLIDKMVEFGIVSIDMENNEVSLYNDYFAGVFGLEKYTVPISIGQLYENIKPAFQDEGLAFNVFKTYIKNRYVNTIENLEINLKNGTVLSMKSNLFLTKDNKSIRLLVFENITGFKAYMKNLENLNKKLNLLNDLSYKLSMVFTLEYAIKTFMEGLCAIKKDNGERIDSIHMNIFDAVNKKTVTSLTYYMIKESENDEPESPNSGKFIMTTNNVDYKDYKSNCELLENGRKKDDTVNDCEFRGTTGSYTCFSLKISDEVVGTVSVDSKDKYFFTEEITALIKEIINMASSVFAKLLLVETNKELAITDPLTGIYNRRYMYEFAKREVARALRNKADLCMAILDIDKFKNINDNYGHQVGDVMLTEFTNDLKNVLMRKQDIITRYGGDEFVMILPDTDKENAVNLMEKLRIYIKNKIYNFEGGLNLNISVSIGFSSLRSLPDGKSIKNNGNPDDILNSILKIADDNLYIAKNTGRDRVEG